MRTQYYTASSLDGFIADSDNSLDWLLQFGMPEDSSYPDFIKDVGALAMGSTTYEWLLRHEIQAEEPRPWPYKHPTWVFTSRSLPPIDGADIRFVQGDVRPVHAEMAAAAAGKNIWIIGGGDLVGQFIDHGLLDELIVQITPVTLGSGAPLLPRKITIPPLKLISATTFSKTFVELRYELPRPKRDSFEADPDA